MSKPPSHDVTSCRNCFEPLGRDAPRFCPHCGQETTLRPPTLFEFAQQFGGAIVSTEGALWRTLKLLVLRPGELTRQYLAGRRKHYVAPVRLYLTASVLALLLLRLGGGDASDVRIFNAGNVTRIPDNSKIHVDIGGVRSRAKADAKGNDKSEDTAAQSADARGNDKSGDASENKTDDKAGNDEPFSCNSNPQWVCDRIARRFSGDSAQVRRAATEIGERFTANIGTLMFVLLPCFALYTKLAWWRRDLRYTEHLVFALHLHAFWFLALMLTAPGWWWLSLPAFAWTVIYTLRAMKAVFGGRPWALVLRASIIAGFYGTTLAIGVAMLGLVVALT